MQNGHEPTGTNASKRIAAFPWRGGKYRLAPKIADLLPSHRIYVEVFGGAASVLLAKPPSEIEVYNDRNGWLVNFFETVRNNPVQFLEKCRWLHYSRQLYYEWRDQLEQDFEEVELDSIEAAVRTAYTISSAFVGDPTKGWRFDRSGARGGSASWTNIASRVAYLSERLRSVNFDHLDFRECIRNWDCPGTLFFLDPPYLSTVSKGYYAFTEQDHRDLAQMLANIQGKFIMTYDDTPEIRELYKRFSIIPLRTPQNSVKVRVGQKRRVFRQILIFNRV